MKQQELPDIIQCTPRRGGDASAGRSLRGFSRLIGICLASSIVAASLSACGAPDGMAMQTPAQVPTVEPVQATQPARQLVTPAVETAQVPDSGDAADDPAVWVHPGDPSLSTVIGTNKKGGLAVYDLAGRQLQYLADGKMNNVDLRTGFPLAGQSVALVAASNRNSSIALYKVNPQTRQLEDVAARQIASGAGYGACLYRSAASGKFYFFGNSERGEVEQWELFDNGAGKVDASLVRSFAVGTQTEGCVADDEFGHLYIGEEDVGIWKYGAEPTAGITRTQVDTTQSGGHLTADVEGLTIYDAGNGAGYLLASSQGNNSYVVYRREGTNAYLTTFQIAGSDRIDDVSQTDGIDVTNANLGPTFPQGMFIVQDGKNDGCNQNFKYVSWQLIADTLGETQSSNMPQPSDTNNAAVVSESQGYHAAPAQSAVSEKSFLPVMSGRC
jgi:3-phytase